MQMANSNRIYPREVVIRSVEARIELNRAADA